MFYLRQSLTRAIACSITVALMATSSLTAEAAPVLSSSSLQNFSPPRSIGFLSDLYQGPGPRTVILVQDLHVNYQVQKNILNLFSFYSQRSLLPSFAAVEGAEGPIDASVMANFTDEDVRREASDYFMKRGELSGPAAFAVNHGLSHFLWGVEKGRYYEFQKALFQKSLEARKSLQKELARLERPLALLKRKEYTAAMRRLDRDNAGYGQGKISGHDYKQNLETLQSLAATSLQKNLVEADRTINLLIRLLRQQVVEGEVKEAATHLDQSLQILASVLDLDDKTLVRVADAVKASIEFYVLAAMREAPMVENTLARMTALKSPVGILVAGGFHTKGLTALLKSQGISYVVITPDVKKINAEDEKLYEDRLMDKHITVAEVLSDRSAGVAGPQAAMLSTGFNLLQDSALWGPIRAFQETRMYRNLIAQGKTAAEAVETVSTALASKSRPAAGIKAGLVLYSYGIDHAPAEEAEYFLGTNPLQALRFIFTHGLNPLGVLARSVGYAWIIASAAVQTLFSPAVSFAGKGGLGQAHMSMGRIFLHYSMQAHRGWNAGPGIMKLARLALPSPADILVQKVAALSRIPGGIVADVGLADSYGRVFSPDGRFFTAEGEFNESQRKFMESLSDKSVQEMVKAGIMYYDIRSGFWREHPEFTVAFALAFAKKIQEKTKKKDGIVIHLAVDAYQHHFEAAQVFADAILRTGITDNGGGIYYWGVRNGGSIRNYAQLYEATHHTGGDWVFFTQSHRTENDISGAKLGIDGEVFCGPQIRHVGSVTSGTLFDGIVDVKNGHVPVTRGRPEGTVINVVDTSANDVKVAADLIRATSAVGRNDIPDNQLLAGAKLYMPVDGRSISMDAVKLLRALGADVAVNGEEVDPHVSPKFVRDPNEHHKPEVLEISERVDEFAALGERRLGAFVDPDGDRAGFSSKVGDAPAVTMPGSELVQLVVAGLAATGRPVTAISDMRTGVGTKDLEKALVTADLKVRVVPFEAGYSFFMKGMAELPADVAIENTLHFFMNPMTNPVWGAPENLRRLDGSKGYQGGDDASLAIAYIVGAMVHQWEGRNPLEQLQWLQKHYDLKPTVTGEKKPALNRENDIEKYDIAERMKALAAAWFGGDSRFQINFNNPEVEVVSGVHLVNNVTGAMVLTRYSNSGPGFTISGEAYRGSAGHENDQLNEMLGLGYLLMAVAVAQLRNEGHQFTFDWKDAASLAGAFDPAKYGLPQFDQLVAAGTASAAPVLEADSAHIAERAERAIGEKLPEGSRIFWPKNDFMAGEPLSSIHPTRTAQQALERIGHSQITYEGFLRGVDGAGSSNDLPGRFREQRNNQAEGLARFSSTPTFASKFKIKVRFERTSNPDVIEYEAPQYKVLESYSELTQPGPNGLISQKDAPNYILRLFGLRGIKITMDDVDERALAGGMGTSGAFNLALLEFANHYSGSGLSQADLVSLGIYLENVVFGGLTGGQEAISTMLGGGYLHIWLRGFRDAEGQFPNGFISIPLPQDSLTEFSKHAVLLQAGKTYESGKAEVNRFATLTNIGWTDGIEDGDPYIVERHLDNVRLTFEYVDALRRGDWQRVAQALDRYVKNRDENTLRWTNVVLDWQENKREGLPPYAEKWANRVFNREGNKYYEQFGAIRDLYQKYGDKLRTMSFYTLDPLAAEIAEARANGLALFPLGAGGPTTIALLFDPEGLPHMQAAFLKPRGFSELTRQEAIDAMTMPGHHEQKGFVPYEVGLEAGRLVGVEADSSLGPIVIQAETSRPAGMMPMKSTRAFVNGLMRLLHWKNGWVRAILETVVAEINPAEDLGVALMTPAQYGASHLNPDLAKAGQKITRAAMIAAAVAAAAFAGQHGYELAAAFKLILLSVVLAEKVVHLALNILKLIGDTVSRRQAAKNAEAAQVNRLAQAILAIGRQIHIGEVVTFASVYMASLVLSFHFGGHDHESARRASERFGYAVIATGA